jgi:LacI family transcriptional regulator
LLTEHPSTTAVIAANDMLAIGVIDAAAERGMSCPGELSVVGFNDMPLAGRLRPPLTTIRVPEYDVGRRSAELLLEIIADPGRRPETVLISGELIVRESTGPPRQD